MKTKVSKVNLWFSILLFLSMIMALAVPTQMVQAATPVYVNPDGVCGGNSPCFTTIQAAIAAVDAGGTVNVAVGTYTETGQIVINKNLTIIGANMTSTIIKPDGDTGSAGDSKGWFLVNSGMTFNLSYVTLDGSGLKIYQAIRHHGSGVIDHVKFTSIKYEESGPAYNGAGVEVITTGNIDVTNSEFSEMGRYGVQDWDGGGTATGVYSGNTYTGKGTGNWLDYAFEIGYGAHVTVQNNIITNNKGVATSDSSGSAGITVWDDAGTQATITANALTNNTVGVAIAVINGATSDPTVIMGAGNVISGGTTGIDIESAGAFGSPSLTITGATISGNVDGVAVVSGMTAGNIKIDNSILSGNSNSGVTNNGAGIVDATHNWWGTFTGPGIVGPGAGDKVSTQVDFSPWCASAACTSFAAGSGGDTTGVFRPSNGVLFMKNANTSGFADIAINYGIPGDYPVTGDWDGNGTATIGIYRNGSFFLRNSNTLGFADMQFDFGQAGDQPIAGDWDGDGTDTIGIFRPSTGQFLLRNSNSAGAPDASFYLGNAGDVGIAGDWDGDGIDSVGVFRPNNGMLFMKNTNTSGFADIAINYGIPGDQPVTGDWDNDGIDTIGVYRNGQFLLRNSNTPGFADIAFYLGNPSDMPIAGNWDGLP